MMCHSFNHDPFLLYIIPTLSVLSVVCTVSVPGNKTITEVPRVLTFLVVRRLPDPSQFTVFLLQALRIRAA